MIIAAILLAGISLSAFFSGSETGFYRVTRVRLVMDAKSGKWISRVLLWLVNHTTVVVATVLIGNNIANYFVSLGLLLFGQWLFASSSEMQSLLPVLATPILFIYGELLPKYLFYQVPYRLLTFSAPLMVVFTVLFAPVSMIVVALEKLWQSSLAKNAAPAGSKFERQELQRILVEGQEAGVLKPIQREIAQNLFTYGGRPVRQFAVPVRGIPCVNGDADQEEILKQSSRRKHPVVVVVDADNSERVVGCYLIADLIINPSQTPPRLPVLHVLASESTIQVLIKLQSSLSPMAVLSDANGRTVGIVERERLMSLLMSES